MNRTALTLTALVLLTTSHTVSALLPPFYETRDEIQAILKDPELEKELGSGEVIEGIEKNDTGYEIHTNRSNLQVDVHYLKQDMPGPRQFELEFHPVEKKSD